MPPPFTALPVPDNVSLRITTAAKKRVRKGQPYIYTSDVTHQNKASQAGALAAVFDDKRRFVAVGFYEPEGPIKVRILARGEPVRIDDAWIRQQLDQAAARREPLLPDTTGYRVVHGEGDGLSGLIIDRYEDTLVIKVYATAWLARLETVLQWCAGATLKPNRIVLRSSRLLQPLLAGCGVHDGMTVWGSAPTGDAPERTWFKENGLRFCADVVRGQKTGFFLDQRDNRQRVGALCEGGRVLNVFSYNGGFSLYAAAAGARHVVSVDLNKHAIADAEVIFAENNAAVHKCEHVTLCGDAFAEMERLHREGARYDVVVIDPPSFAKRATEVVAAKTAYARLARWGSALCAPGGRLVFASCSSRIDMDTLSEALISGVRTSGRHVVVDVKTTQGLDHPVAHPSLSYLKCIYGTVA